MGAALSSLGRLSWLAPVILRVAVGVVMAYHGYAKLMGGPGAFGEQMLAPLGVPAPILVGYLQTLAELVGGIFLIVGFLSRLSAAVEAVILVLAIFLVKLNIGLIAPPEAPLPGAELDIALLAGLLAVMLLGPGRPSLDHAVGIEGDVPVLAAQDRRASLAH